MAGENCTLSIPRFGEFRVVVTRLTHGVNMFTFGSYNEDKSRHGKQFATSKRTSGSFDIDIIFNSYERYVRMMDVLSRYIRYISYPDVITQPIAVTIPSRNFFKTAIPEGAIPFGDQVGTVTYGMTLSFMGSSSPLEINEDLVSKFERPTEADDPVLPYLYPAGQVAVMGTIDPDAPEFDVSPYPGIV